MKRTVAIVASAIAALALSCSAASAHGTKKKVRAVEVGMGVASTVAYGSIIGWSWTKHSSRFNWGAYGYVTAGCVVLSPIVASVVLQRQVTAREFWSMTGSCVIPIVGAYVAEAIYDANNPPPRHHRHHKKKMM